MIFLMSAANRIKYVSRILFLKINKLKNTGSVKKL